MVVERWLPPHELPVQQWLYNFRDIVLLELSTARINKAKHTTLATWKEAASSITSMINTIIDLIE